MHLFLFLELQDSESFDDGSLDSDNNRKGVVNE